MDDLRVGACFRAERRRRGLRQVDVAAIAGVTQQTVSQVENGRAGDMTLRTMRQICAAMEIRVELGLRTRGPDLGRLADARHARLVSAVVALLGPAWRCIPEYSFNDYGDRGSVDVLAWNEAAGALLLIEVKSEIVALQATLRSMNVKDRVLPKVVSRDHLWRPGAVGSVLVLPDESTARRQVASHSPAFDAALPARTVAVRRWVRAPSGHLRGVWFLSDTPARRGIRNPGSRGRVRRQLAG
jgi:transcriptional regulator with XRE-family HTH domain